MYHKQLSADIKCTIRNKNFFCALWIYRIHHKISLFYFRKKIVFYTIRYAFFPQYQNDFYPAEIYRVRRHIWNNIFKNLPYVHNLEHPWRERPLWGTRVRVLACRRAHHLNLQPNKKIKLKISKLYVCHLIRIFIIRTNMYVFVRLSVGKAYKIKICKSKNVHHLNLAPWVHILT